MPSLSEQIPVSGPHTPSIEDQRRFWDWHWQHWQERKALNEWTARRAETILTLLQSLQLDYPKLLDLGCGKGWFTGMLAQFGEATGIDLSEEAISMARSEYPDARFIAGNLYEAPLPLKYFDVVVSQEVIAHVEDQTRYVQRAAEVLKPGGHLIVTTGNKFVIQRLGDVHWNVQPPDHIARQLDMKALRQLLHPHFDVLQAKTIIPLGQRGILRLTNSYKLNAALSLLIPRRRLEILKERAGLGYHMIVLARKRA